ncbi:hypothetical protein [Nonomuraea aridisoli]|uniref:Uncharacterized protein n=1 Tax=Nonomuraea aridisoli TaxID=2070368 RepID=A0A2W2DQS0_9ACTN|nr:hypothetical protein [Nonomuraea aridisoli]PZG14292.1 hypothetical protein C1J01_27430 [Nonomuraea aridisoli]
MADDLDAIPDDDPHARGGGDPEPAPADDPRNEPAPFGTVVVLTAGSAVAVMGLTALLSDPPGMKFLLFGPLALVVWEVIAFEVWWRRWWGAVPGAVAGLLVYFEGRQALGDVIGDAWAHPVAYVTAWTLFAVVFALCSRYPRTL